MELYLRFTSKGNGIYAMADRATAISGASRYIRRNGGIIQEASSQHMVVNVDGELVKIIVRDLNRREGVVCRINGG